MNEALLALIFVVILPLICAVNIVAAGYTWKLLKDVRELLRSNAYLNATAIDLLNYGIRRGYEQGLGKRWGAKVRM